MVPIWKRLANTIEIPFDPLNEDSNRENIISALINLVILILGIYLVPMIIERGIAALPTLLIFSMLLTLVVLRIMLHKVSTRVISILLAAFLWMFVNVVFLFFENGLRAPTYLAGLAFVVVYVGLLHGQRAVLVVTILSTFTGLVDWFLESRGIFLARPRMADIRWTIIGLLVILPMIAFMISRTLQNLKKSIALYRSESEIREHSELEVKQLNQDLEDAYATTLEGWARALELRDKETEGHSRRVVQLTVDLSLAMGVDKDAIKYITYGAMLHDIGKMGIPDVILRKPGQLTAEEWQIIRQHPSMAYDLLKSIGYLKPALDIPYSHHENWDGSGYPQGLKGEAIPLPARVFRVVDAWDALTTDRPYRKAWPVQQVIDYLLENKNSLFDPQVVDRFLDHLQTERLASIPTAA